MRVMVLVKATEDSEVLRHRLPAAAQTSDSPWVAGRPDAAPAGAAARQSAST